MSYIRLYSTYHYISRIHLLDALSAGGDRPGRQCGVPRKPVPINKYIYLGDYI